MWSISSEDIQRAKERVELRRGEIETRYAEELRGVDAELDSIAMLERVAAEFASRNPQGEMTAQFAPEQPGEAAVTNGGVESKSGSRWRLHLGGRPGEADGGTLSAQR